MRKTLFGRIKDFFRTLKKEMAIRRFNKELLKVYKKSGIIVKVK